MILSDREILAAIEHGQIVIRPSPDPPITAQTIHAGFGRVGSTEEQDQGSPIQLEIFHLDDLTVTLDKAMADSWNCKILFRRRG